MAAQGLKLLISNFLFTLLSKLIASSAYSIVQFILMHSINMFINKIDSAELNLGGRGEGQKES